MLKMVYVEGRTIPTYFCDVCTTQIENAKSAVFIFKRLGDLTAQNSEVKMAHKGECHTSAELSLGGHLQTGWHEMSRMLYHAAHNAQLTPESWEQLNQDDAEFGRF